MDYHFLNLPYYKFLNQLPKNITLNLIIQQIFDHYIIKSIVKLLKKLYLYSIYRNFHDMDF